MIKARMSGRKTLMIIENLIEHYHPKNKPASESKELKIPGLLILFS
tara:strand:+ start:453 stop:590 length:138 start_codon:yes stop_codon:yes gene_type:complete